jgi:predicted peptidase
MLACLVRHCFTVPLLHVLLLAACTEITCNSQHALHMTAVHHLYSQDQTQTVELHKRFYVGEVVLEASYWFLVIFVHQCGLSGSQRIQKLIQESRNVDKRHTCTLPSPSPTWQYVMGDMFIASISDQNYLHLMWCQMKENEVDDLDV